MSALSSEHGGLSSLDGAMRPWLAIVGLGEDGRAGLSGAAQAALDAAELVVGGARHLALAAPLAAETLAWPSPLTDAFATIIARRGGNVCVLASGDPFHYGVGVQLAALVAPGEMRVFPQPSAFSLAAARLGWALQDCALVSLHGRDFSRIIPDLQPGRRALALSWDGATPAKLACLLRERGFGGSRLHVLEALGGPRERIRAQRADAFDLSDIDPLNLVAIECQASADARVVSLATGLDDAFFEHDGQLTKADMRAITLAALAPRAGELLWDVGAGAGSIAIEWRLRHQANRAIAIEARADRADRIMRNCVALGAADIIVKQAHAPPAYHALPTPDAIFIGGGLGDANVLEDAWRALKSGGRMVANSVTLEGEMKLADAFARYGGTMKRVALSHLESIGGLHGWRAARTVTQWRGMKP